MWEMIIVLHLSQVIVWWLARTWRHEAKFHVESLFIHQMIWRTNIIYFTCLKESLLVPFYKHLSPSQWLSPFKILGKGEIFLLMSCWCHHTPMDTCQIRVGAFHFFYGSRLSLCVIYFDRLTKVSSVPLCTDRNLGMDLTGSLLACHTVFDFPECPMWTATLVPCVDTWATRCALSGRKDS
jgi:hypothetical protein